MLRDEKNRCPCKHGCIESRLKDIWNWSASWQPDSRKKCEEKNCKEKLNVPTTKNHSFYKYGRSFLRRLIVKWVPKTKKNNSDHTIQTKNRRRNRWRKLVWNCQRAVVGKEGTKKSVQMNCKRNKYTFSATTLKRQTGSQSCSKVSWETVGACACGHH